jgi:hypothetical protein
LERHAGREQYFKRWAEGTWVEGQWHARNPLAARCGVFDLYRLAKILRAEVSPRGVVRYLDRSWLYYLSNLRLPLPQRDFSKDEIHRIEEVLRSAFDFACDLIQWRDGVYL